ncbi:GTPase-activating protein [Scheffersomyces stipitis CBS 6054]|uniref:GTPase-activating protein n=1 Tax=Scheffersomyces stipitis (strain ATCC 58785 / CBS 6054 / NBRC 10063 / NRRL Y-11545) TaxID=322104 RepID=A3LZE1_PICST|nr:GTPase-activating protein [Scheffersomyces stipitis CBS 6054]ABN68141.2 GTPase-activating protein [Scheffersomyces stipitis CBS 6054]
MVSRKYQSPFHKIISRDKGLFEGKNFLVSTDSINWIHSHTLSITEQGQLYSSDENDSHYLLLQSLQSCHVQIFSSLASSQQHHQTLQPRRLNRASVSPMDKQPPVVFIKTYENDRLYIRVLSKNNFGQLLSSLIVWQNFKPQGLVKKWYCENKVEYSTSATSVPHELLVCRFKIFGPIPSRSKNLTIVSGPKAPVYQPKAESTAADFVSVDGNGNANGGVDHVHEGWFYAIGALKSNGSLNFLSELDGTLLYTIDVKSIMSSEIREIHNSIFDNSNVLFIGQLKELRFNNVIKTTSSLSTDQLVTSFLTRDGKMVQNNQRILIEFPLHIDLEDWFVGLNYFAKREYIGSYYFQPKQLVLKKGEFDITHPPPLTDFTRENFRVSKKITIDIIEAKFENFERQHARHHEKHEDPDGKIYAEVRMWGYPWSRTAIVNHTNNPFWKEEFSTDLPISTQMIHILIKKCAYNDSYSAADKLIGTVYVTPDILTKKVKSSSTVMTGTNSGNVIDVNGYSAAGTSSQNNTISFYNNNEIVRLSIYDASNLPIGKLLLHVNLKEHHILPPPYFRSLESMLGNAPMKDLIHYCNVNVPTSDFEDVSLMMLDIFQSLGVEDQWFKALMEAELVNVDILTRKLYKKKNSDHKEAQTSASNNAFNTLFRGSSIFSKSLERYNLRIGQEYLEKALAGFFTKISMEKKNCELDPRYVSLQEKKLRQGKEIDDSDSDSEFTSDSEDEVVDEEEREKNVNKMLEDNFENLYDYVEEVWHKIYITSNDLPAQIKIQLKNFRTKVELACDPDDKTTPLNCLSAFIFLRFFCPAILNPKLFYLTKNHQSGTTQRTLTLIAKILLNFANRQEFTKHKEPHLLRMNKFLKKHRKEIYDYFDKITGRKNDFNEKILDLSHDVKRFDLGLGNDSTSNELPTTPYLIDKYLRLTELIHLLDFNRFGNSSAITSPVSLFATSAGNNESADSENGPEPNGEKNGNGAKDEYQIGTLEFEKNEFLDSAAVNETEGFSKSLRRGNENIFSFITSNITLRDLQKQSTKITAKVHQLETVLENFEFPNNLLPNQNNPDPSFTNDILSRCYLDVSRACLVYLDKDLPYNHNYRKVVEQNALSSLKLKFSTESRASHVRNASVVSTSASISTSFTNNSLGSALRNGARSSIRRWLRKN